MSLTKIGSIGINTGIQLAGVTTVSTLHVGSGVTLSSDGDGFFTGITSFTRNVTGDYAVKISNTHATGQGLHIRGGSTNSQYALLVEDYAAANLFEVNGDGEVEVKANHLRASHGVVVTGIVTAASFAGSGANLTGIDTDLVSDTTPQLGGNLDVNSKAINFGDSNGSTTNIAKFGADGDLHIYHEDGAGNVINSYSSNDFKIYANGNTEILTNNAETCAKFIKNGAVELYHDNSKKFETSSAGSTLTGDLTVTGIIYGGSHISILDSDGSSDMLKIGADEDLRIYHYNNNTYIRQHTDKPLVIGGTSTGQSLYLSPKDGEYAAIFKPNSSVDLYYDNVKTFHTKQNGIVVEGTEGAGAILEMRADEGDDNADYFRLYNDSGFLYFQNYGSGSWQNLLSLQQQNQTRLFYAGSEKLNTSAHGISITGKIYMNNGNLQFGASGNGIDFSATSDASGASSELLDDYEEGTWSPTLSSGTATTYLNQWYTKIGQVVTCYVYLYNFSDTSSNTHFNISGLPFAHKTNHEATVQFMSNGSANLSSNCMGIWGRIGVTGNTDQIAVYTHFNTTGGGQFSHNNLGSTHLMATFSYVTGS